MRTPISIVCGLLCAIVALFVVSAAPARAGEPAPGIRVASSVHELGTAASSATLSEISSIDTASLVRSAESVNRFSYDISLERASADTRTDDVARAVTLAEGARLRDVSPPELVDVSRAVPIRYGWKTTKRPPSAPART
jgi:hypothetical protein